jgi:predicted Zn-dependent peptidase
MRRSLYTSLVALSFCFEIGCADAANSVASNSRTLPNGIRVVSVFFPGSTNLAIFTYLPMGLASDGPRQSQWSHLVEHLVIRSTVSDLQTANAETLPDNLRLDFYGNLSTWKDGLSHHKRWLEGVPFTEASLVQEKPKVKAECDFTAKNFATHKFAAAAWAQGYRHGQTHAALKGDVDRASLDEIQKYRDTRLAVLSNTLVCVVGGLESDKIFSACSEQFGNLKSKAEPARPVKSQPGSREMTWDLDARHLLLTWPMPAANSPDYAALFTAAQWLNMNFYTDADLKKMAGMVLAGVDLVTPEGNFFYASASLRPGSSFKDVQEKLERQIERLSAAQDLSMAPMIARQLSQSLTTLPDPALMKAQIPPSMTMAMVEMNVGLQWGMNEYRYGANKTALASKLAALNVEEVRQAASTYLTSSNRTSITLSSQKP